MTRAQLEHIIRAAASVADDDEIVIIGSQAVLGGFPDAPKEMLVSMEADLYPLHYPERGDLIDGTIGEGSPFHETFGYYGQGVDASTAVLPDGWRERLVPIRNANTGGATGWCLDVNDAVLSKLVAGREKDVEFARAALTYGLATADILRHRAATLPVADRVRRIVLDRIGAAS